MIVSRAPLRISFFGGGTDYPEYFQREPGAVLATAIDKFSYVTASPFPSQLFDYSLRIAYRKVESVKSVAEIEHHVYRECLKLCGLEQDIELHNIADLPAFTGLGSSSTFTVALLHALHSFKGEFVRPMDLAYEAIHIERQCLHENVGCQDQTMAAVGGFQMIEFRGEDNILCHRVPLSPQRRLDLEQHLLLVFTRMTRRASDIVAQQLRRVDDNIPTLRRMRAMVDEGLNILTGSQPLEAFGALLHQSWMAKHSLASGVSNGEIDALYEQGLQAGAMGGKLLGAGGGGFLLFFAPPEAHARLRATFASHQLLTAKIDAPGSEIIFS
jgi:D-glycero-alpha-D-manno-heptose-7-phosphate kinase